MAGFVHFPLPTFTPWGLRQRHAVTQLMSDSMSQLQRSWERHVKQPGACITHFSYSSIRAPKSPASDVLDLAPAGFRFKETPLHILSGKSVSPARLHWL